MESKTNPMTECLDILARCRRGLDIPRPFYVATFYTPDSLICLFRYLDQKLYRIEIREVTNENGSSSTDPV